MKTHAIFIGEPGSRGAEMKFMKQTEDSSINAVRQLSSDSDLKSGSKSSSVSPSSNAEVEDNEKENVSKIKYIGPKFKAKQRYRRFDFRDHRNPLNFY